MKNGVDQNQKSCIMNQVLRKVKLPQSQPNYYEAQKRVFCWDKINISHKRDRAGRV